MTRNRRQEHSHVSGQIHAQPNENLVLVRWMNLLDSQLIIQDYNAKLNETHFKISLQVVTKGELCTRQIANENRLCNDESQGDSKIEKIVRLILMHAEGRPWNWFIVAFLLQSRRIQAVVSCGIVFPPQSEPLFVLNLSDRMPFGPYER